MNTTKSFDKVLWEIGMKLAELREKNGYKTIKEFADTHDLPRIHYWRMEKGKTNITLKSLSKILAIHGLALEDFFCVETCDQQPA
jgi:transcriptional regulator with XRE-family HTH domain